MGDFSRPIIGISKCLEFEMCRYDGSRINNNFVRNMKKYVDFWKITEDSLDFAMKTHKIDIKFKNQLLDLYKKLNAYPELSNCLKYLREKKIACEISNEIDLSQNLIEDFNNKNVKSKRMEFADYKALPNSAELNLTLQMYPMN